MAGGSSIEGRPRLGPCDGRLKERSVARRFPPRCGIPIRRLAAAGYRQRRWARFPFETGRRPSSAAEPRTSRRRTPRRAADRVPDLHLLRRLPSLPAHALSLPLKRVRHVTGFSKACRLLIPRSTGARAIRRQLHVGFNTAGRKGLNLDSFDESVVEYRCCCRRFESVGPTVTNVEHRTTEHHSAAGRAMPSTTPQA